MGLEPLLQYKKQKTDEDVVYFINQRCKTFDPRTQKKDLDFKLYDYQEELARDLLEHIREGKDLFIEKSRDMGITWLVLAVIYYLFRTEKNFQALLGSRKENYVDDGTLQTLFPRIMYMIKNDPYPIEGFNPKEHKTYMKLINPENKSTLIGESANPNFSRQGRFNVVVFDELAFWQHQQSSWEAAGDASPCRIGVTTPSEQLSYAKDLRNAGKTEVKTIHWRLHPLKDEEWYESEKLRRTNEEIARELDINWEGSLTNIVYPEHSACQFGEYPFVPEMPLYISWDFGLDGTAIGWWQRDPTTGKHRRIESYFKINKPIHFFMPLFGKPIQADMGYSNEDVEFINKVKNWTSAVHYGDPDVEKRSYQTKDMTSTREVLQQNGIIVQTNTKSNDFESRKTETKLLLQNGIEVNDTPNNHLWYEAIKASRYPQRDEGSQATSAITKPIHDWSSHHRTETEYYAVNIKDVRTKPKKKIIGYTGGDNITGYGRTPIWG